MANENMTPAQEERVALLIRLAGEERPSAFLMPVRMADLHLLEVAAGLKNLDHAEAEDETVIGASSGQVWELCRAADAAVKGGA